MLFDAGDNNVARYKLTSGALTTDTGGDGNGLTLTNVGSVTNTAGFLGGANTAALLASGKYLTSASHAALNFSTALTISAWIKLTSGISYYHVVSKSRLTTDRSYEFYYNVPSSCMTLLLSTGTGGTAGISADAIPYNT